MGRRQKGQWRRSTSVAVYLPLAVLLISLLAIYGTSVFLKVAHIEVIGASRYPEEEIIAVAAISSGDNILLLDEISAERRIYEKMPYISRADISRRLPDTIRIEITESTPIGVISVQGELWLIDSAGRLLEMAASMPLGLITISGITPIEPSAGSMIAVEPAAEARLEYMSNLLTHFEIAGLQKIVTSLDVTNIGNITFVYDNRIKVILGGPDDIEYKLEKMIDTISKIPDNHAAEGTIDLSEDLKTRWRPD